MARWAVFASVGLIFVGVAAMPATDDDKGLQDTSRVAYVNTDIILQQTPGYASADSTLARERQVYQGEVEQLQAQFDSAVRAFDQQSLVLSPQAREDKLEELRQMQQRNQQRVSELQSRDLERRRELVAPLEARIQTVIDGVRAERNLVMIFDVSSPTSNIISADPALDLTSLVVQRLQAGDG